MRRRRNRRTDRDQRADEEALPARGRQASGGNGGRGRTVQEGATVAELWHAANMNLPDCGCRCLVRCTSLLLRFALIGFRVLCSTMVREAHSRLKAVEKEGFQGGKGDNNWVVRHRHI